MTLRRLIFALVTLIAVLLAAVTGTSGGVQSAAERPVSAAVVSAERAHLGLNVELISPVPQSENAIGGDENRSNASHASRVAVDLRNRFGDDTRLAVTARVNGQAGRTTLGPGDGTTLRFRGARCGQSVAVRATAPNGGVVVEATRTVPCPE